MPPQESPSTHPPPTSGQACLAGWYGNAALSGYDRNSRVDSLLSGVSQLHVAGGKLFVEDRYGVSTVSATSIIEPPEQIVGRGGDAVFEDNLSPRGLSHDGTDSRAHANVFFATNGVDLLVQIPDFKKWTDQRKDANMVEVAGELVPNPTPERVFIDGSIAQTERFYCHQEDVQVQADDIVRGHIQGIGTPRFSDIRIFTANLANAGLITPVDRADVLGLNWIVLEETPPCATARMLD